MTRIDELDAALADFLGGRLGIEALCELHGCWYMQLALAAAAANGEFDALALRSRDGGRWCVHLEIAEQVASLICTDHEATQVEFRRCGRMGATAAAARVREIAARRSSPIGP
jgi:hypothetical protein